MVIGRDEETRSEGSSPLTRGFGIKKQIYKLYFRFIPAYAGVCPAGLRPAFYREVHPRLRGGLQLKKASCNFLRGSSPLTRGFAHTPNLLTVFLRFIPAYAGVCPAGLRLAFYREVHPRLRGGLVCFVLGHSFAAGSSPLTRGFASKKGLRHSRNRFIPAYAGVCGENWKAVATT